MNITDGAQVSVTGRPRTWAMYDEGITRGDLSCLAPALSSPSQAAPTIGYERPAIVTVSNGGFAPDRRYDTFISRWTTRRRRAVTITGAGSQFTAGDLYVGDYSGASGTLDSGCRCPCRYR